MSLLIVVSVAVLFLGAGFWAISKHYPHDASDAKVHRKRTRRYIEFVLASGQMLAGLGTCGALVYAALQLDQSRNQFFQDFATKSESELNQRLSDTIQHLGNEDAIVREGALLRLRFLYQHAAESSNSPNRGGGAAPGIISDAEIELLLVGYIRTHATQSHFEETILKKQLWPPPDLLTAISLLSDVSRNRAARANGSGQFKLLDLSGVCLAQADLTEINMSYWNLDNADLHDSKLDYCDFTWSSLSGANVQNVSLRNAILTQTHLNGADLRNSDFANAILEKTFLHGANLEESVNLPAEPFLRLRVSIDSSTVLPPTVEFRPAKQRNKLKP